MQQAHKPAPGSGVQQVQAAEIITKLKSIPLCNNYVFKDTANSFAGLSVGKMWKIQLLSLASFSKC